MAALLPNGGNGGREKYDISDCFHNVCAEPDQNISDTPLQLVFSTKGMGGSEETWFHWCTGADSVSELLEWDSWEAMSTQEKLSHIKNEVALGITICFAQIPESVAFAFMAHIKPPVAIHAAWVVGLICSLFGGRTGMVNGAEGAFAAIIATFIPEPKKTGGNGEGIELLFPSVIVCGIFMLVIWGARLYQFISLVPASVMIGFCNGLAIVIGNSQLHPFKDGHGDEKHWKTGAEFWWMFMEMIAAMLIMEFLPKVPSKLTKILPSSLIAIIGAVLLEFAFVRPVGGRTNTIGDVEKFEFSFPYPFFLNSDYDLSLIGGEDIPKIILQGGLLAVAGIVQGLLTTEVVYDFVKTPTYTPAVCLSCGVANVLSGFLGGMGGDAMIGLSTLNCLSGGRGRLGPVVVALGIALCMLFAYPLLNFIPMAALAGVMIVVVLHTFKWFSIPMVIAALLPEQLRPYLYLPEKVDRFDMLIVVAVTVVVVAANLVYAVALGLVLAGLRYSWDTSQDFELEAITIEGTKIYLVKGRLFFATAMRFHTCFDYENDPEKVIIFLEMGPTDYSASASLGKVEALYVQEGKQVAFHFCSPSYLKAPPHEQPQVSIKDVQAVLRECREFEEVEPKDEPLLKSAPPPSALTPAAAPAVATPAVATPPVATPPPQFSNGHESAPPAAEPRQLRGHDAGKHNGLGKHDGAHGAHGAAVAAAAKRLAAAAPARQPEPARRGFGSLHDVSKQLQQCCRFM